MNFQFDALANGRVVRLLNTIDEHAGEGSTIEIDRSIDADQVVRVLARIALARGMPAYVRFETAPNTLLPPPVTSLRSLAATARTGMTHQITTTRAV